MAARIRLDSFQTKSLCCWLYWYALLTFFTTFEYSESTSSLVWLLFGCRKNTIVNMVIELRFSSSSSFLPSFSFSRSAACGDSVSNSATLPSRSSLATVFVVDFARSDFFFLVFFHLPSVGTWIGYAMQCSGSSDSSNSFLWYARAGVRMLARSLVGNPATFSHAAACDPDSLRLWWWSSWWCRMDDELCDEGRLPPRVVSASARRSSRISSNSPACSASLTRCWIGGTSGG